MNTKESYMKKALVLAKRGINKTSPNPMVGAVIVLDDEIIGKGFHEKFGEAHAEVNAINDALKHGYSGKDFSKAVLYVTLEPCCHVGKTGPCCEVIVKNGFQKVVIAHLDPSNKVNGKGVEYLKKHGVNVEIGILEYEARKLNQGFLKTSGSGIPFVTLKAGISLDGRISTGHGVPEWITNQTSRKHGYDIRYWHDAIVVGANTVIVDNPKLFSGKGGKGRLFRVILDGRLRVGLDSQVFRDENVFVAHTDQASKAKIKEFQKKGIKIKNFGKSKINIKKLLKYLYGKFGILSVFVEGGGEVNGSFVDEKLIDQVYFYIAPEIIGGRNSISVVEGDGVKSVKDDLKIKNLSVKMLDGDILVHGIVNEY